jgi:hypothetical protein
VHAALDRSAVLFSLVKLGSFCQLATYNCIHIALFKQVETREITHNPPAARDCAATPLCCRALITRVDRRQELRSAHSHRLSAILARQALSDLVNGKSGISGAPRTRATRRSCRQYATRGSLCCGAGSLLGRAIPTKPHQRGTPVTRPCLTLHAWQIGRIAFRGTIVGHSIPIRERPRDFAAARISASSVASGRLRRWASSR